MNRFVSSDSARTASPKHWWLALGVTVVALAVYIATLAPGLTFEHTGYDGGDLIAAARTLGIPHPTGYPTYTLLAWLFTHLPIGTIAYRVNLLSATCAAVAAGLLYLTTQALAPNDETPWTSTIISAATALTFAFSSLLWSQAVITEVYALLTLFASLILWLLVRWRNGGSNAFLWVAALALGLGLGNHITLIFVAPAAFVLLWPERRRWVPPRAWLPASGLFLLGLLVYAYLPLAASRGPAVNWGNPQTWKGFWWVVSAKQYQGFAFGLELSAIPGRIGNWAELFGGQFGWWGLVIALAGAWWLWQRDRQFSLFGLTWALLVMAYAFFYDTGDSHVYLLPVVMLLALCWGDGTRYLLHLVTTNRPSWQRPALVAILLLPLASLILHWRTIDLSQDWSDHAYAYQLLEPVEPDSLIVVRGDKPTFALWYRVYAEEKRTDVAIVSGPMLAFIWYRNHARDLYPELVINEPKGGNLTWDNLVQDLIDSNLPHRAVYLTDLKEEWEDWVDYTEQGSVPIYQVDQVEPLKK